MEGNLGDEEAGSEDYTGVSFSVDFNEVAFLAGNKFQSVKIVALPRFILFGCQKNL